MHVCVCTCMCVSELEMVVYEREFVKMQRENVQTFDGCVTGGYTSLLHTPELRIPPHGRRPMVVSR